MLDKLSRVLTIIPAPNELNWDQQPGWDFYRATSTPTTLAEGLQENLDSWEQFVWGKVVNYSAAWATDQGDQVKNGLALTPANVLPIASAAEAAPDLQFEAAPVISQGDMALEPDAMTLYTCPLFGYEYGVVEGVLLNFSPINHRLVIACKFKKTGRIRKSSDLLLRAIDPHLQCANLLDTLRKPKRKRKRSRYD